MNRLKIAAALVLPLYLASSHVSAQTANDEDPPVPFRFALGMETYQTMCAECHGQWATGTDSGPPLINGYYVPSHHSDQAFHQAILRGARQHHWNFGDMPAVPGATSQDAENIVTFVRWLQQYRGLY